MYIATYLILLTYLLGLVCQLAVMTIYDRNDAKHDYHLATGLYLPASAEILHHPPQLADFKNRGR